MKKYLSIPLLSTALAIPGFSPGIFDGASCDVDSAFRHNLLLCIRDDIDETYCLPSCSFWADNFNGTAVHLHAINIALVAISNTEIRKLNEYKKRMGWDFPWFSSVGNDFNRDFEVTFTEEEVEKGKLHYNYQETKFPSTEGPGISVFARGDDGRIYHTYSTYARGLDMLNGAYHYIDLTPRGRAGEDTKGNMYWLKRHDQY